LHRRIGLLERQLVLLDIDFRKQFVLPHLELRAGDRALPEGQLAIVVRTSRALLCLALRNLLLQILQLGPSIERVFDLLLAIELDDEIALVDSRTWPDQGCNDEVI